MLILITLIITPYTIAQNDNQDIEVLKAYFDEEQFKDKDSVFLGLKNTNEYIFTQFKGYLELKKKLS